MKIIWGQIFMAIELVRGGIRGWSRIDMIEIEEFCFQKSAKMGMKAMLGHLKVLAEISKLLDQK